MGPGSVKIITITESAMGGRNHEIAAPPGVIALNYGAEDTRHPWAQRTRRDGT